MKLTVVVWQLFEYSKMCNLVECKFKHMALYNLHATCENVVYVLESLFKLDSKQKNKMYASKA